MSSGKNKMFKKDLQFNFPVEAILNDIDTLLKQLVVLSFMKWKPKRK